MKRTRATLLGAWLFLALPAPSARAQQQDGPAPPIERIELKGNQFLQK